MKQYEISGQYRPSTANMTNTMKARYQPFFCPSYKNKRKRERDYGVTAAARGLSERGWRFPRRCSRGASSDQPENVQTHNRPREIFHSVGVFPSNFPWCFLCARAGPRDRDLKLSASVRKLE